MGVGRMYVGTLELHAQVSSQLLAYKIILQTFSQDRVAEV